MLAGQMVSPATCGNLAVVPEFRAASVNMHMGVPDGMSLEPRNERRAAVEDLARFLREEEVDVAFVQEVRNDSPESRIGGVPRQFELLRELCGATDSAFHATLSSLDGEQYGICMLARNGVRFSRVHPVRLPYGGTREPRIVQVAQAVVEGVPVVVANLHLDHTGSDRGDQLDEVGRLLAGLLDHDTFDAVDVHRDVLHVMPYRGPVVIGGDFNDAADVIAERLAPARLINVVDGLDGDDPRRGNSHDVGRIDHLLHSAGIELVDQQLHVVPCHALQEGTGVTDHLALVAQLRVAETA